MVRVLPGEHRSAGGWPRGWRVPAGTQISRSVLPKSVPPEAFTRPNRVARVPVGPYGFAQGTVSGAGAVTLSIGPIGFGTSWDLAQASITTTTGSTDQATVAFYAQPAGTPAQPFQVGFSYLGGGDQVGLAGIKLVTGERLYAVWAGGHSGDIATLILTGIMTALI